VLWNTVTLEATGNEKGFLEALRVQDVKTKEERKIPVSGLFFAIGHEPASKFLNGQVRLLVRLRLLVVSPLIDRDGCLLASSGATFVCELCRIMIVLFSTLFLGQ